MERLSAKPLIDVRERKEYMFFLDKEGYLCKAKYARGNKLSPQEIKRREEDKRRRRDAWEQRKAEWRAKKSAQIAERKKRLKERLASLG